MVNEDTVDAAQRETYWLGESFAREVVDLGIGTAAQGDVYGILLPLENSDGNWGDHKEASAEAYSGMIISQKSTGQRDLFQFRSLHVGEDIQKNYMIAIEDIREPSNPVANPYGSFTVCVKNMAGQTVERYSGCNLNPSDPNYLGKESEINTLSGMKQTVDIEPTVIFRINQILSMLILSNSSKMVVAKDSCLPVSKDQFVQKDLLLLIIQKEQIR